MEGAVTDRRQWDVPGLETVVSFGVDSAGEPYVLPQDGTEYRVVGEA
jgi:hypothetical protein